MLSLPPRPDDKEVKYQIYFITLIIYLLLRLLRRHGLQLRDGELALLLLILVGSLEDRMANQSSVFTVSDQSQSGIYLKDGGPGAASELEHVADPEAVVGAGEALTLVVLRPVGRVQVKQVKADWFLRTGLYLEADM